MIYQFNAKRENGKIVSGTIFQGGVVS